MTCAVTAPAARCAPARCAPDSAPAPSLYDADEPLGVAATVGLPGWRAEQILEQELSAEHEDLDERTRNAELLRAELGD